MKISIEYPQVLKMQYTSQLEVSSSATLADVKGKVFEDFWSFYMKVFHPAVGKHGTLDDIRLSEKTIEITTDESLRERLANTPTFQVVFKEH